MSSCSSRRSTRLPCRTATGAIRCAAATSRCSCRRCAPLARHRCPAAPPARPSSRPGGEGRRNPRRAKLAPSVALPQPVRDPLERLTRQGRRFPAHPALVHPDHPVQVNPGRPTLVVPPAPADGPKVAIPFVVLARQLHPQVGARRLGGHHEHRPVLAAPVVLLK